MIRGLVALLFAVAAVPNARGGSISGCAPNLSGIGITCNVFETDASGNASEISSIFPLGDTAVAGYVVLLETAGADQSNTANWSDVLHFIDNGGGLATTAQLLSQGCNCFPDFATVNASGGTFIVENPAPPTVYTASGTDIYNIFSFEEAPEPVSFLLAALGLAALLAKRYFTT